MRHRHGNEQKRRRRIVTTGAAIIAVAAIALGITLYNKSADPTGPLPVIYPQRRLPTWACIAKASLSRTPEVTAFTTLPEPVRT